MSKNPDQLLEKANALFEAEDHNGCIEFIQQESLLTGDFELTPEQLEQLHFLMGDSSFFTERYQQAVPHYKESFSLLKQMPDQQEKMLQRLTDIGHAYSWQNDWESGKEFYEKAFEFAVDYFGKESEETFNVETSLVNAYNQLEEYENAEATYRRLLDYAMSNFEADDERFREYYISLANSLFMADKDEESLGYYEKAFALITSEDEDYLPNLRRIIELYEKFPKGDTVQEYREKLVDTLEKEGEASEELAQIADTLTSYYWKKKDVEKALKYTQIAYANYQSVLGESHQRTMKCGQVYSVLLFDTGDFSSALSMNEKLIDYYESSGDNEEMLLTLYYNNGMIFNNLEKYNSAADAFQKAIRLSKKLNGEFHEKTVRNIQKLAQVYSDQNKETEAADLLKPYIESYERSDNPGEALLAALRKTLADSCYYIPGRTMDALKLYQQALEYYQKTSQEKSSDALIIANQLARIQYGKLQNYEQAAQQLSEWLNDAEGIYREDHWRMRQTRYQLAMAFYRQDKFSESEEAARLLLEKLQVLENQKALSKSQQITKLDTLYLLGTNALKTSGKEKAAPFITEAWELCQAHCKTGDEREKNIRKMMALFSGVAAQKEYDYTSEKKKYFAFMDKQLNEPLSKRRVRVFISSTFRDMMGEREHLIKNVFPKLKSQCRELGIDFSEVDLRWGVTEDDVEQGKVIEICLDEIDRSRPYFIGILGERYGWVPTMGSFANFERVLHNYEWLKDDFEQGLSITEMEIQYGVLRNPAMKGNAFFYLRDEKLTPGEEFKEDKGSEEYKKLIELKQHLRKQDDFPVKDFDAIEKLGEMIYEDLAGSVFDDEDLKIKEDSPEQKLRDQLEYINLLRDFYLPDEKLLKNVRKKLKRTNRLLISGKHGSGKTAFLANWIANHAEHFEEVLPVFYFPDATAGSKDFRVVLDDLILQLKQVFPSLPDFQRHHPNPAQALAEVLNAIPEKENVYMIIDGVDRLKQMDFFGPLYWIPSQLPGHVKLIFSSNDSSTQEVLEEKGFDVIEVASLREKLQKPFINDYLWKYGKKLPSAVVKKIVKHPLSDNSLALKVLLDELRIFGRHEELMQHLDFYLEATDTVGLFGKVLHRLEDDYEEPAPGVVRKTLMHLAASHKGLTEEELLEVCNTAPLFWSPVYSALENYILRNNGLLTINNMSLEQAIKDRYLSEEQGLELVHSRLADYFASADEQRKRNEYAWHLWKAGRDNDLKSYITQVPVLIYYYRNDPFEFITYFDELSGKFDLMSEIKMSVEEYEQREKDISVLGDGLAKIITLLGNHTDPGKLGWFREKQAALADSNEASGAIDRAESLLRQGDLAVSKLQFPAALSSFEEALDILNQNPGYKPVCKMKALMGIAQVYLQDKKWEESCQKAKEALDFTVATMGKDNLALITIYDHLARVEHERGNHQEAIRLADEGLRIAQEYAGKEHMAVAILLSTKAVITQEMSASPQQAFKDALPLYEQAYHIQLKQFGENSLQPIISAAAIAGIVAEVEKIEEYRDLITVNFERSKRVLGSEHQFYKILTKYKMMADTSYVAVAWENGDQDEAVRTAISAYTLGKEELGTDHQLTQSNLRFIRRAAEILEDEDLMREFGEG